MYRKTNNPLDKYEDVARCIKMQENTLIQLQSDVFKTAGYTELDPKDSR